MSTEITIHKLEELGLGKAPFRIVGFYAMPSRALLEANPTAYNMALKMAPADVSVGTCAMCGVGLTNNYIIRSADGKKHAVGCDCVLKINNTRLTTDIKELQRKARREKKEAERQAKAAAYEAELQAQKDRNGGLTDYELAVKQRQEAERARLAPQIALLSQLADELEDGKYGFCDSVAKDLRNARVPTGRGLTIMLDILAKKAGRVNSKAYAERLEAVTAIINKVATLNEETK